MEAYGSLRLIGTLPFEGFSTNLLKLLPKEFQVPITTAIRTLSKSDKEVTALSKVINFTAQGERHIAKVVFDRIDQRTYPHEKFYLIAIKIKEPTADQTTLPVLESQMASGMEIQQLQNLLKETRENLQLTIEELESSNEEAQATNEELVSSNEELQSTNEELQSVNEELYTVNAELQEKNIQLLELNSDIENLINSSHIATLFLDDRLHIRRFTPSIKNIIDLRESDIGRSITNFALPNKDFLNEIRAVSNGKKIIRKEIITKNRTWFLQEIRSYTAEGEGKKGTVINYTDITEFKRISNDSEEKTKFLHEIFELSPNNIYIYDLETQETIFSNSSTTELVGYTSEELSKMEDKVLETVVHPEDIRKVQANHRKMRTAKENEVHTVQYRLIKENEETKWVESVNKPFEINEDGTVKTIIGIATILEKRRQP
ncbi:MAG: two-component system CheB/CheR fusion protein [Paraglaciecola sp.]